MVKFWRVLVVCVLLALTINIRVNFRCSFVDISPNASRRKPLPHEGNYSGSERISTPGAELTKRPISTPGARAAPGRKGMYRNACDRRQQAESSNPSDHPFLR